jgi:Cof subfamily protein (haloacid dehalogenase superfamily)
MSRAYDAIVLDIDGTLLDDREQLSPRTAAAIAAARGAGVKVMLATGRSHDGVRELARQLALDLPSVVLNGAAVYCHRSDRLLERYTLPNDLVHTLIAHARERDLLPVVACEQGQFARAPLAHEAEMLSGFSHLTHVDETQLPREQALRMTLFSLRHSASEALHAEVRGFFGVHTAYCTHFALSALAGFRDSAAQVVDVQPDCQGKAEALRLLRTQHGIAASRVVAVGDAGNDLPILSAVGLPVAMGNATAEVKRVAKRVIGTNNSEALAELIETLFG